MLAQHDCHVAHGWDVPSHTPYQVTLFQITLTLGIEFCVVGYVVVAFREEFRVRKGNF